MMTDVLPRLDGAVDGSDRRTIDRRQLLRAGAWAAPVIVLATSAPAAAQSVPPTAPTNLTTAPATTASKPSVGASPNTVNLWSVLFSYDYNQWNLGGQNSQTDGPQSATLTVRVTVRKADGTVAGELVPQQTIVLAKYETKAYSSALTIAPGTYVVVAEVLSTVYSPNTINGRAFASPYAQAKSDTFVVKSQW